MTFPLKEMYGYSRLCDRLRSSAIIWKQVSLRSSAVRDRLRSFAIIWKPALTVRQFLKENVGKVRSPMVARVGGSPFTRDKFSPYQRSLNTFLTAPAIYFFFHVVEKLALSPQRKCNFHCNAGENASF